MSTIPRRSQTTVTVTRLRAWVGAVSAVLLLAGCTSSPARPVVPRASGSASSASSTGGAPGHSPTAKPTPSKTAPAKARPAPPPWQAPLSPHVKGHLRAGSKPAVLPADLLIADKLNNRLIVVDPTGRIRWQFPRKGDLARGQTFEVPDDAFLSSNGRYIVATQEDQAVVTLIDVARHRIVYRYGVPGRPGAGANRLSNPDDAMLLRNNKILGADIKNCRLVILTPGKHRPARVIGHTTQQCLHAPPAHWGSPNGAFPMRNGHFLITEINGDWVDELALPDKVLWSANPPGVAYPSDTNEIGPNRYLTVDYSSPGQVVIFNRHGTLLWRYGGHGRDTLDHPSLALPLPNGDVILNDDYNHRVIVVDPRTNHIVWQYGHTGVAGSRPGYLDNPDGLDLVPPHSLLATHPSATGR